MYVHQHQVTNIIGVGSWNAETKLINSVAGYFQNIENIRMGVQP